MYGDVGWLYLVYWWITICVEFGYRIMSIECKCDMQQVFIRNESKVGY